jgi:phosphoribosylformylglycinamidine synthase
MATAFGESASRVVVSVAAERAHELLARASAAGVPVSVIGRVGGNHIRLSVDGRIVIDEALGVAERMWSTAIDRYFESPHEGRG